MARRPKAIPIHVEPERKGPVVSEEEALGRNLAAAFIATREGLGLDYARKKHAHEPVGEFWRSLARMVIDHLIPDSAPPRRPPTIQ
jgi:hypothetical protein